MKNDRVYIAHMLQAIEEIELFSANGLGDIKTVRAVERGVEIVGEAARKLSPALKERYSEVPWLDIIGMRHKIAHDYFGVDTDILLDTVQNDLPELKHALAKILKELP